MNDFKKLFAIDLDGTLLNKKKHISKESLNALKEYANAGGEIVIITGKSISSGKKYINIIEKKLDIKLKYAGFLAGSIVYDLQNDKIVAHERFKEEDLEFVFNTAQTYGVSFLGVDQVEGNEIYYLKGKL